MRGGLGNDVIYGEQGNDFLAGGANEDVLVGGSGDDRLFGGGGNDQLSGGSGNDAAYGGDGADTFEFGLGDNQDYFNGGAGDWTDVIDLGNLWALTEAEGPWTLSLDGQATEFDMASEALSLDSHSNGLLTLSDGSETQF